MSDERLPPWDAWAHGLMRLSSLARSRVLLAPARAAYEAWRRGHASGRSEWVTDCLWSIEETLVGVPVELIPARLAFDAAYEVRGEEPPTLERAAEAVGHAGRALRDEADPVDPLLAFRLASTATDGPRIFARLREETVPWALGLRDVVAERVAARRGTREV